MPMPDLMELLNFAAEDGPQLLNTTTGASILPTHAVHTLPANHFKYPGKKLWVKVRGRISCVVTTPGNLTFDLKFGSIIVWTSGTINLNVVAKTDRPFELDLPLTARAYGSGTSANMIGIGKFTSEAVVGSPLPTVGGNGALLLPVGAPAVGNGFNSAASQAVDLFATFSVATATTALTVHEYELWSH